MPARNHMTRQLKRIVEYLVKMKRPVPTSQIALAVWKLDFATLSERQRSAAKNRVVKGIQRARRALPEGAQLHCLRDDTHQKETIWWLTGKGLVP